MCLAKNDFGVRLGSAENLQAPVVALAHPQYYRYVHPKVYLHDLKRDLEVRRSI